ncbi:MAG: hypothetical protein Kow0025_08500 [Thermodesulfovibrionales bacterium]
MYKALRVCALLSLAVCALFLVSQARAGDKAARFDGEGKLLLPSGYESWISVGTALTPNDMNGGKAAFPEFHTIYMDPESFGVYSKTGEFPEGTVMVKVTRLIGAREAPNGKGYFMGEPVVLAAGVKDTGRFPGNRHGWGFFVFGDPREPAPRAEVMPAGDCNLCHEAAAKEQVFTQYYPALR